MKVPKSLREVDRDGVVVRTQEYDDGSIIAVDFGDTGEDVAIDVVDSVALIVTDDEQFEFELPPKASDITVNNGVLTIKE